MQSNFIKMINQSSQFSNLCVLRLEILNAASSMHLQSTVYE